MKRSGGFAVVEFLIIAVIIAIIGVGGYYVAKRNHHKSEGNSATTSPPAKSTDPTKFFIPEFGIQLVNVPSDIKDLMYAFFPATTDAKYTQADFSTSALYTQDSDCTIGELNRYPGKFNADEIQGSGNFVKQFKGFWIEEIDVGVQCSKNQSILSMQNSQITTFKQFVTKPDNLQLLQ